MKATAVSPAKSLLSPKSANCYFSAGHNMRVPRRAHRTIRPFYMAHLCHTADREQSKSGLRCLHFRPLQSSWSTRGVTPSRRAERSPAAARRAPRRCGRAGSGRRLLTGGSVRGVRACEATDRRRVRGGARVKRTHEKGIRIICGL